MPVPQRVSNEVRRLALRTQRQIESMQDVSLVRIRKLYRDASKRIGTRIASNWGDVDYLRRIQADLTNDLYGLSKRIQGEVEKNIVSASGVGLRASSDQGRIVVPYLKGNQSPLLVGASLTRARQAVIKTLQTSVSGITLSERIWEHHRRALRDIRQVVAEGMLDRDFRSKVVQRVKRFLIISESDMRKKEWREFFKRYPPGRGVYRSAYKNAERVVRTETMRAYRVATNEYARRRAWVHGLAWRLSPAHPRFDICDEFASADMYGLGAGVYPPDAVPDSAHAHCMCYLELIPREDLVSEVEVAA